MCEHFVFRTNTQELFYNICDDCLKYYRSNVELKSTALSAISTTVLSSYRHIDLQRVTLIYPNLSLEVEDKKLSRKLFRTSTVYFTIITWAVRLSASFQQQFSDSYCFQLIIKSILMHAFRI
jgi:hypothetical protein